MADKIKSSRFSFDPFELHISGGPSHPVLQAIHQSSRQQEQVRDQNQEDQRSLTGWARRMEEEMKRAKIILWARDIEMARGDLEKAERSVERERFERGVERIYKQDSNEAVRVKDMKKDNRTGWMMVRVEEDDVKETDTGGTERSKTRA